MRINRDLLFIGAPTATIVVGSFAFALIAMRPAPPSEITMSTGTADGTYHAVGVRYRDILARDGVTVRLIPSSGAVENFRRLIDPESDVHVTFVQGGIARDQNLQEVFSLGSLYYEPLWVFTRGRERITRLSALKGKTIAIGPMNSGTATLASLLLQHSGVTQPSTRILRSGGQAAVDLLISGNIDAVFLMMEAEAPLIHTLTRTPGVQLMHFEQADAYIREHPYLSALTVPQGMFDLERNIPDRAITLIGTPASLLVDGDLHPALTYLLLRAATQIHGTPALFRRPREFPSPAYTEVSLSPEAVRFYESGPPFLQRYLPYWAANFLDRLLVMLLPAIAVLIPASRLLPALYRWRVRSRIYRWYGKLKEIELELEQRRTQEELHRILARLDDIEEAVNHLDTPLAYSDGLYMFRQHIDLVRQRTHARVARSDGQSTLPAPGNA
ncbi:MAG: ABC transporter substrate-binding protein [Burkholderiales bacterium]|nr:ABC transporter substrate-binding protein [Burkholderiales bacterium]